MECARGGKFNFLLQFTKNSYLSGDKQLDGYQKKKYVCKLLFIFLLGNDIDFGHMEAVNLLSSNKYTEKQIVSTKFTLPPVKCLRCCTTSTPTYAVNTDK